MKKLTCMLTGSGRKGNADDLGGWLSAIEEEGKHTHCNLN